MKKISCFICGLSSGGAEHQISNLSNFLDEKQYQVELVTFSSVEDHYKIHKSIKRIRLGLHKNKFYQLIDIWKYFFTTKSEVVISFGQRENFLCIIPLFFRPKIKLIAGERNTTYGKPTNIERILHKLFYKRADWIVPNSFAQENYIKKNAPQFAFKVKSIINFTDINKYTYTTLPINSQIRFGIFCRYTPQKNYIRFAEAIKKVLNLGYHNFLIDWYGDSKYKDTKQNPHYEKFSSLIKELQIESHLKLHDKISSVVEEMSKCDAIILPSLYEGFSNTLSEAICCGRPCLCGNISDNAIMIQHNKNGYMFNPEDINDIALTIIKYLNTSLDKRMEMSIQSRNNAEKLFNKNIFINDYLYLINNAPLKNEII